MTPTLCLELPIVVVSEANAHEHYRIRQQRAKAQRGAVALLLRAHRVPVIPCVVRLTRVAPRRLDDDNNVGAHKHVRDQIAAWLGVDDRDHRVAWLYAQERFDARRHAVRLEIFEAATTRTIIEPAYLADPWKDIVP